MTHMESTQVVLWQSTNIYGDLAAYYEHGRLLFKFV